MMLDDKTVTSRPATSWCSRRPITPGSIMARSHAASYSR
jgi:hypothetical protein